MIRAIAVGLFSFSLVASALATDVPIAGERLRIRSAPRRLDVISRDPAITLNGNDPTVAGATLDVYGATGERVTFPLPAAQWAARQPGPRFRFYSREPRIKALIESGRILKVVVGKPGGFPLGSPQGSVATRLATGDTRLCAVFGGVVWKDDGERFVARQAPAPASCPEAPSDPCFGVVCGATDACHAAGVCDPQTGLCTNPSKADGTACDDGIACTASSSCQGGVCVSADPTCRNESSQSDRSYCDLSTGVCAVDTTCPPRFVRTNGAPDLCTSNVGKDPTTGLCLYQGTFCPASGCNLESCNPDTGACEVTANNVLACGSTGQICVNLDSDNTPCDVSACSYEHCRRNPLQPQNCEKLESRNCAAENPSTCQQASSCDPSAGCSVSGLQGCLPPSDPCEELVMDPNASGCCTYRPKDCAARFGNDPSYVYACAAGVCTATPH